MASNYKSLKQILFGRPLASDRLDHERLSKKTGLAVLSSDNISSVAYATEQTLIVLAVLGTAALIGCSDRSELNRQAQAATTKRLVGTWDVRFHLDRPVVVGSTSASKEDVPGELAFLANRWVGPVYPMRDTPSDYGTFDVDFTSFGFEARGDNETPTAVARWVDHDSLEIILGDPNSDITVRMGGRATGDSIAGGWRVLVARTGGGGGHFVMVRHK